MNILTALQEQGVIDATQAQAALAEAEKSNVTVESVLLQQGISAEKILAALGTYYKLPTRELGENTKIDSSILKYLSEDSARHYKLLPLALTDGVMEIGVTDPDDLGALDALNFISAQNKIPYKLVLMLERDLLQGLALYDNLEGEVDVALTELDSELEESIDAVRDYLESRTSVVGESDGSFVYAIF